MTLSRPKPTFQDLDPKMKTFVLEYLQERVDEAQVDKASLDREYGRGFCDALGASIDHLKQV